MATEFLNKVCERKPDLADLVELLKSSVHGRMQIDALEIGLMVGYSGDQRSRHQVPTG